MPHPRQLKLTGRWEGVVLALLREPHPRFLEAESEYCLLGKLPEGFSWSSHPTSNSESPLSTVSS